jgi:dethiobiotin synthetase
MRPRRLIVVTGTGTEVGKTWVACGLTAALAGRGLRVAARKPVQSYDAGEETTDAVVLARASGEETRAVCPPGRWYPLAMAPPMAAAELGRPVPSIQDLADQLRASWPSPAADVGLVEGAGGVASPLGADGDTADLARGIGVDLAVLVADARLGVINAVRLSVAALAPLPAVVYLNRFDRADRLQVLNRDWLSERAGFPVMTGISPLADVVLGD